MEYSVRSLSLLDAALVCLADGCPIERNMQLCMMQDEYDDECCVRCWRAYLWWIADGRRIDPYRAERIHDGGLVG